MRRLLAMALGCLGCLPSARGDLRVHEPFDYPVANDPISGRLAGRNGGTGFGGAWLDSTSGSNGGEAFVYDSRGNPSALFGGSFGADRPNWDGVVNGGFPTSGGYAGLSDWSSEGAGNDRLNSHRPLAESAGSLAGADGVLWLSAVWHLQNNAFFASCGIALTSDNASFVERGRSLSGSGSGIGVGWGASPNVNEDLNPIFFANGVQTVRTLGPNLSTSLDHIVILKFEFGATDKVSAAAFTENEALTEAAFDTRAVSATSAINENSLTTLAFSTIRKENAVDEFRLGDTFADVTAAAPPPPREPFEITAFTRDGSRAEITLTWTSVPGETYGIEWSSDLVTYYPDVHQAIPAHPTEGRTTFGPFAVPGPVTGRLYLRIAPPDTSPPVLLSMGGSGRQVVLTFSEPMVPGSATDPAHYLFERVGGGAIGIVSVSLGATPDTVVLHLDSSLEEGAGYVVTVNGVTDPAGLPIAPSSQATFAAWTAPLISEVMASNGSSIHNQAILLDEDGASSDWIEILNPTGEAVELGGWFLTDDADNLTKWRFPDATLAPGAFLLVFASDKDRARAGSELHANFNLSADGEYLALVRPDGLGVVSGFSPGFPGQVTGLSYGWTGGSGSVIRYFDAATPGLPNPASGFLGVVGDTRFDLHRGFYENPIEVQLTSASPGAIVRYTTDMSEPTLANGTTVTPGVAISVTTTTCLRARAFMTGWLPSNTDTQTYIFPADVITQPNNPPGFPATWGSQTAEYDMNPAVTGRYAGAEITAALKAIPSISVVTAMGNLFDNATGIYDNASQEGVAWERPASMEWIDPGGGPEIQVNCGLRIQGNAARIFPKKPFRLLFKSIYGPSKLEFPVFADSPGAAESLDTLVLRSNSQSRNFAAKFQITDENGRRTLLDMGYPQAHGTFVHLYVNGLYWGLYNPVERPQASFCATYLGGSEEEWDVNNGNTAIDGTYAPFDAMLAQVRGGPATDAALQKIQGRFPDGTPDPASPAYLDMPNYIDYMLSNFYLGTLDWAGNASQGTRNYYCGRRRIDESPGYQWFIWDAEATLGSGIPTGVIYGPAEPYAWLKGNAEFRLQFADRAHRHLLNGGALTAGVRLPRFTAIADRVRAAFLCEEARWEPATVDFFESQVAALSGNWFPNRANAVLARLKSDGLYPSLDAPTFSQHGGSVAPGAGIVLAAPAGAIHFTTDGSDPRLFGGAVSPTAAVYSGPIVLGTPATLSARTLSGGVWSALTRAFFSIDSEPAGPANLVLSEIHYHPGEPASPAEIAVSQDRDDYEFLELYNIGTKTVDLTGVGFSRGIAFDFADEVLLAPAARVVLVRNRAAFSARYGAPPPGLIAGEFTGRLSNDGERITLDGQGGGILRDFTYNDKAPWPVEADGSGVSLVLRSPESHPDPALAASWVGGAVPGGTPGTGD